MKTERDFWTMKATNDIAFACDMGPEHQDVYIHVVNSNSVAEARKKLAAYLRALEKAERKARATA